MITARRSKVDTLVVESTEFGQSVGHGGLHTDTAGGGRRPQHRSDECTELPLACLAAQLTNRFRKFVGSHHTRSNGVLEVVAHVRDAIGPTHDLALGRRRCGSAPGVIANSVEGFGAQIQRNESDVGAPHRVVETAVDVRRQSIFARVTAGAMTAVVAESDRLGECDVEAEGSRDRNRDLGDFESVSEARSLMVVGKDEDLGLAGQSTERGGVKNAIAIALETGAERIGLLRDGSPSGADRPGGQAGQARFGGVFAGLAIEDACVTASGPRITVRHDDRVGDVAGHRARPSSRTFGDVSSSRVVVHVHEVTSGVWQ